MSVNKLALLGGTPIRTQQFPQWPVHDKREEELLLDALRTGKWWRYAGDKVAQFEKFFAQRHDAKFALAVTNGTAALEASMCAIDLQPGDEVLVPSYTFVATATAVILHGGIPRFVDVEPETLNIDLKHAEQCVTSKTKAIIPVHFGGLSCDMDAMMAFAERHNLYVVEDAAQAHGARWNGKGVGSYGHISGFSFQASKNVTAGEGGLILTDDEQLLSRAYSRHTFGRRPGQPWYTHYVVSTNLRMTEWQGAILLAQLERMDELNKLRTRNALMLNEAIAAIPGLSPIRSLDPRASERAYHLYIFRVHPEEAGISRDRFIEALEAEGIPCETGYPFPLYEQPLFQNVPGPDDQPPYPELILPQVTQLCNEVVWIRQNMLLGTEEDTKDIIRGIEKVMSNVADLK